MPPWQRERMPLLFAGDGELLAAGDLIVSARLDTWCRAHGLRLCLAACVRRQSAIDRASRRKPTLCA